MIDNLEIFQLIDKLEFFQLSYISRLWCFSYKSIGHIHDDTFSIIYLASHMFYLLMPSQGIINIFRDTLPSGHNKQVHQQKQLTLEGR